MSQQHIEDKSADHKYFIVIPQIVWAKARSPYDVTLWFVVKMIAGDDSECFVSTRDLAKLSMMSTGKVTDCRRFLLQEKLLEGELRRDPGYPLEVWHLRIPDLWPENMRWRTGLGDSLRARIAMKDSQKTIHKANREERSPGEQPPSPGEQPPSPGERKDIQKENQKDTLPPFEDWFDHCVAFAKKKEQQGGEAEWSVPGNGLVSEAISYLYELMGSDPPKEGSGTWHRVYNKIEPVLRERGVKDIARIRAALASFREESPVTFKPFYGSFADQLHEHLGRTDGGRKVIKEKANKKIIKVGR